MVRISGLVICLLLVLSACDVRPSGALPPALAEIEVAPMADRKGQIARLALQAALNPQGLDLPPRYRLEAQVSTATRVPLGEGSDLQTAVEILTLSARLLDATESQIWSGARSRTALYAKHQLPTLALDTQEALWADLAALAAQDMAQELSGVLAGP